MKVTNKRFTEVYRREFRPHLEAESEFRREDTFGEAIEYLESLNKERYLVVETGCMRQPTWSDGRSTALFDRFAQVCGGKVFSVDISSENCEYAERNTSAQTSIINQDSILFLQRFARDSSIAIDLLYLDSYDLDLCNPHPSALHHLMELCGAAPALASGSLVVVDDHCGSEIAGKSEYVLHWMDRIGATELFNAYQIGWIIP